MFSKPWKPITHVGTVPAEDNQKSAPCSKSEMLHIFLGFTPKPGQTGNLAPSLTRVLKNLLAFFGRNIPDTNSFIITYELDIS
jgi:hypothetical protein